MTGSAGAILNGIFALILALVVWRMTHSFIGWAALFAPGAGLVLWGLVRVLRGD